jgi:iron complex transport system substrate-binding protein
MEQIMLWNPDIIYVGNFSNEMPEDFINNSFESQDWSVINAIKEKAIYKVPLGVYRWDPPSQESPLMWKWLLKKQHLELADYDMKAVTSGFYEEFYDYALSEEQLSKIFYEVE